MGSDKTSMLGMRISSKIRRFVEIRAKTKMQTVQELLMDLLVTELKKNLSEITYQEAIELVSKKYGFSGSTGTMLMCNDQVFIGDKIEKGIITIEKLGNFREQVKALYQTNLETNKRELSQNDDLDDPK